jgi:hypothetical protein
MRLVHTAIKHSDNDKKRDIKKKIHARMIRLRKELDQLITV